MLGLAAVLGAPSRQHQIDFRMPSPNSIERINQLWLVTFIDGAGQEAQVRGPVVAKYNSGFHLCCSTSSLFFWKI